MAVVVVGRRRRRRARGRLEMGEIVCEFVALNRMGSVKEIPGMG